MFNPHTYATPRHKWTENYEQKLKHNNEAANYRFQMTSAGRDLLSTLIPVVAFHPQNAVQQQQTDQIKLINLDISIN